MRHVAAVAGVTLATSLAACAMTPEPPPAPPAAAAAPSFQRAAYAGTKQRMDFLTTLSPDCSYMGPSSYQFPVRPQHGQIEFKSAREAPAFTPGNIHFRCNERRVQGVMLYYTPDRAFGGVDRFTMEWISPAGLLYRREYEVTIK